MKVHPRLAHLKNSGKMGYLTATFDWSKTSLGDPESWPQSLVTTVGIVLENKIAMYLVWGQDYINFYNDAYIDILGSKHPRSLGAKAIDVWPEVWTTIHPLFETVYTGETVHYENMPLVVNMNGEMVDRFYSFSYTPVFVEDGTIGGVLDTVIDTTSEIQHKEKLKKSEEQFRSFQELSPVPFYTIDPDWNLTYMNQAALKTLNRTNEEIIGKNIWKSFPGLEGTVFGDAYKRSMNGELSNAEGFFESYGRWYSITSYNLQPGVAVSFQDITERKNLEIDLNQAIASRDEFLSIASHELKTPLTALKIQSQSAVREINKNNPVIFEPERLKRYFMQSDRQVSRITRLVDDMLDVSRIISGKLHFQLAHSDFKMILTETLDHMSDQFDMSRSGKPHVHYRGESFTGNWDAFRLEQVINNLFTNAIRYGEGKPINVVLGDLGDAICFTVSDQGKGISESDKTLIFDRFTRAENSDFQQGLGLGLFISKEIVIGHKGKIEVESSLGKGSSFEVILPKN